MCNDAHKEALKRQGFGRCLTCQGAGRVEDGKMLCGRAVPTAQFVTLGQASICGGKHPDLEGKGRVLNGVYYDLKLPDILAKLVAQGKFPAPVNSW